MLGGSSVKTKKIGSFQVIETTLSNGMVIPSTIGAPSDEEIGRQSVHPYHLCGGCRSSSKGNFQFQVCGGCKDRKYCSQTCQRKHWREYKAI